MGLTREQREYKRLYKSLIDNLTARGLTDNVYLDKVDEYMDLWKRRRQLSADIAARGLTVTDDQGRRTENRSVSLEVQVSRQMLAIFTALGYKDGKGALGAIDDEL